MIVFLVGIIVGSIIGVTTMCIIVCGKRTDREMEQWAKQDPSEEEKIPYEQ